MEAFTYESLAQRVVFGEGAINTVGVEVERLGASRALVLSTPQRVDDAAKLAVSLGGLSAGIFSGALMHTPVEVTEVALAILAERNADCVVSLGGGSTIGLGKAIALRTDVPQIVIPTTYAGSEATSILGQTKNGNKTTLRSLKVLPETILYDVDLTLTLPPVLSATSGINAIAHAVEALYAEHRNPVISLIALDGIRSLAQSLPRIVLDYKQVQARSDAQYGAWACGTCLGAVGMALHHQICHILGGSYGLPHAETHAVMLAHVVAYNERAAAMQLAPVAKLFGTDTAAAGLHALACRLDVATSLDRIGMPKEGIDSVVEQVVELPYWNPRSIERHSIKRLILNAYYGRPPASDERNE